jgi:PAS domain S-box-containing protein
LALLASTIPLIFTDDTIFFFHLIFVLLTIGAFFCEFRAFVVRVGILVTVVVAVLLFKILAGEVPAEELSEIPLLTMMILVAFAIARQRSRAGDALRRERDTLSTIMENTQAHLAYLDTEFNFVRVNSIYVRGCGHSREQLLGHNHFDLFPNPENQAIFEQVRDTGQPVEFRAKPFEFPDQPERGITYWDWTLAPVTNEDGQVEGLVLSLLDVTERVRAEEVLQERTKELDERVKELNCLYGISALVEKPGVSLAEIFQGTVDLIPPAWQYPEITGARVTLEGDEFRTVHFSENATWQQSADIIVHGQPSGSVEVCYLEEKPESDEGPFLIEERSLINAIAERLGEIIKQVRAEALLREQSQFITTVFESLRHPFYVVDANDYTIKMANSVALVGELPHGITCFALTHGRRTPCAEAGHSCPIEEIKKTGNPAVMEHIHYDKEGRRRAYEVHGHPILDDEGKVKQVIEYTLDVTERKQMEEALRAARDELEVRVQERTAALAATNRALRTEIAERVQAQETLRDSEERYRRLVELAFEAIAIHSQGTLVYVNPQAVKLLGGASPEEFIGKPIRDFVHPDYWNLAQARVQQVGEEGKGVPLVEETLIRLDGTSVEVEAASVPIMYQGRSAVQSVIHDISPRKRAEAERERERARIARNLHDSLGHSLGYLHLKLDQLTSEDAVSKREAVRQELVQMRDVANQAYELVRGMLAALLPSNASDLTTALLVQARSVCGRAGIEVQVNSEGQPRRLSPIVQQQLVYLFREALVNVEKHAKARQVDINLAWGEDTLTLSLSDDGQGFDPEQVGAGGHFGLAIMQERAQEINGQLALNSRPDSGTELVLRLPLEGRSQSARRV